MAMSPFAILDEESRERFQRVQMRLAGEEIDESVGYRILAKDGRKLWVTLNVRLNHAEGESILVVAHDITERKQAADALRESEERFRTIAETVPVLVCITRLEDGIVQFTNEYNNKAFGLRGEDIIGSKGPDYYCDSSDRVKMIELLREKGSVDNYPLKVKKHDGTPFWILTSVRPITFQGQPAIIGASIDITQQKEAEEALRETTQYLDNLINYANAPIIVWDPQFRITRFNHAFEQLNGRDASEVIGQHIGVLFPDKYRARSLDVIQRTIGGEYLKVVEIPIKRKDGDVRVVLWNSATILEPDGKTVISTIAQGQDITERKIVEAENIRAREEWEGTFNTVPDLIAILDKKHRIIRVNKAMADQLGTTTEKCIGLLCHEAVHGTAVPPEFCPHAKTCADGKQHIAEVHEPGLGGTFIVSTTPLFTPDGNLLGTVHVAHDITDRKRAEEELKQRHTDLNAAYEEITATQEELHQNVEELTLREQELLQSEANLKEALAEKEILLSEIHHRVKNNLAAFISLLSLDGTYEDTEGGRALRKDLQNRARSMALIHETLYRTGKFSKVDMGIYLSTLIDQIASTFKGSVIVHTVVDARGVVLDLARATTAGLIINELVTNSFKYAFPASFDCMAVRGESCTIRVSFIEERGTILLTVADNGCGLPADLDPRTTKSLGLKLVNFLGRHQLRAEIAVMKNKGTEFIFRLDKTEDHL